MNACAGSSDHDPLKRKRFIAALLLKRNVSPDTVQELTQLSKDEIQDLLLQAQQTLTQ
ncbi:hypothetical protein [Bacillus sp. SJS]|uniref:hypothetical protein n=1 Tax=Bacillus sp. SJS TaxID=1423321 RepID=UPI000B1E701D|nr:hypothetical protein [Bacillus sp. SJS]